MTNTLALSIPRQEPRQAATDGTHDGHEMQYVFHELHPDGRNALCAVCDSQYRSA